VIGTRLGRTGHDVTGRDKARHDLPNGGVRIPRQDMTGRDRTGQDETRLFDWWRAEYLDETRQDATRRDMTRRDMTGRDKTFGGVRLPRPDET